MKDVPVKLRRCTGRKLKGFAPADFQVLPPTVLREMKKPISNRPPNIRFENQRFARVAERKAYPAPTRESTPHFHYRNQCRHPPSNKKLKIKRPMLVRLMKHPRPGTGMETPSVTVQNNKV